MMMAARFRSVFWVAIASIAGLCCYMITQYVAGERLALAHLERQVMRSRVAVRDLQTELGTRGSMAQLERWNEQALALAAPRADQFVKSEAQLAMLGRPPVAAQPHAATPGGGAPAELAQVSYRHVATPAPQPAEPAPVATPTFRQATYVRPAHDHVAETPEKVSLLASTTLAEIGRIANNERSRSRPENQ
ncbi:MAG TPA: hypothetical protein VNZ43_06550 [Sphingomonadaceae bacterium]|nr:hypothetical protein [Sphingomonadaceae bacterium]